MAWTGPVRRTNLIVRDMDAALRFYRDLLGFEVFFDDFVPSGAGGRILDVPCEGARMVVLRADEGTVGMIGLMELRGAQGLTPPVERSGVGLSEPFLALQWRRRAFPSSIGLQNSACRAGSCARWRSAIPTDCSST